MLLIQNILFQDLVFIYVLLEDNCFTMLWWSLTYINTNQSNYIYIPSLEPPAPLISPPWVVTEGQAGLPVLQSSFPLLTCFTHDSLYMSMLLSQFVLPSPPAVSTRPFSTFAFPFLLCKQVYHTIFSRFHKCALIYNICFSLSDLLHSL